MFKLNDCFPYLTAWDDGDSEEACEVERKKIFASSSEILLDYTQYSTIQGLIYIFFSYQTIIGRLFWSAVLFFMFILGLYWCIQAYQDWKEHPVLTTITTTGYSINEVSSKAFKILHFFGNLFCLIISQIRALVKRAILTPNITIL